MSLREERARRRHRAGERERAPDGRMFRVATIGDAFDPDQQQALRQAIGPAAALVLPALADLIVNRWTGPAPGPSPNYKIIEARFATLGKALHACARAAEAIGLDGATAAEEAHAFDGEPWLETARVRSAQRFADDGVGAGWVLAAQDCEARQDRWLDDLAKHVRGAAATIDRVRPRLHAHHGGRARQLRGQKSAVAEVRRWLAFDAARIVTQAGIPLRKSRFGVFGKILAVVYQSAKLDTDGKLDVFRDVAWVVERRRRLAETLAKLTPLPTQTHPR